MYWQMVHLVREVCTNAIIRSEMISRRRALSLMGLAAAFGLAAAPTVLAVSDAEAQTVGMQRPMCCDALTPGGFDLFRLTG